MRLLRLEDCPDYLGGSKWPSYRRDTEKRRQGGHGGRNENDVLSKELLEGCGARRNKEGLLPWGLQGAGPTNSITLDFWPPQL